MDFPRNIPLPTHICSWSCWMNGNVQRNTCSTGIPTVTSWTANVAVYIPLYLPWPYPVKRVFWLHGSTISGHVDVGLYSRSGSRIWSAGPVVNSGFSQQPQFVTVSPDLLLQPGRYWMGFSHDGSTNQVTGANAAADTGGRLAGLYQQAAAHPLPGSATFEAYAGVGLPLIGITNTDSGF